MSKNTKLIFVYNANSGKLNAFFDTLHKKISPSTYQCNLCQLTYGSFTEMPEWKSFRENFSGEMEFLHIDEFEKKYPKAGSYPVVYQVTDSGNLEVLLNTEQVDHFKNLQELIAFFEDWANKDK